MTPASRLYVVVKMAVKTIHWMSFAGDQTVLFGTSATDPRAIVGVPAGLVAAALLACLLPARRVPPGSIRPRSSRKNDYFHDLHDTGLRPAFLSLFYIA